MLFDKCLHKGEDLSDVKSSVRFFLIARIRVTLAELRAEKAHVGN